MIAVVAFAWIVCELDPGGSYPSMPAGPGLTVDESFNVQQGVRLTRAMPSWLRGELSLREAFGDADDLKGRAAPAGVHLPDHPPLGRLWLGACHNATARIAPPADPEGPYTVACARVGSAAAFAVLALVIGIAAGRHRGPLAGTAASLALVLMPRAFGHAHLASLETCMNLAYVAAALAVAGWPNATGGLRWRAVAFSGIIFGLALLTKMQAVLLTVPVGCWALWRFRLRGVAAVVAWGLIGLAVFFVLWPWLWIEPANHLVEYFARTTDRSSLNVWYLGEKWADREVPWHYPTVMFLVTVPLAVHVLGIVGTCSALKRRDDAYGRARSAGWLLAGCIVFPIGLFSLPAITVYDGSRLFLMVFPLWAIFAGFGAETVWRRLFAVEGRKSKRHRGAFVAVGAATVLAATTVGHWLNRPAYLSYYNLLVGGTAGAERLGFELDYWGEGVARDLLDEVSQTVPAGAVVEVVPVLHPGQLPALLSAAPPLRAAKIRLEPFHARDDPRGPPPARAEPRYVLYYRRLADLSPELRTLPAGAGVLASVQRQGVVLAALIEIKPDD